MRLCGPENGGTKYQVLFRAPAGEGEPWKRVLRGASSEEDARKILAQAAEVARLWTFGQVAEDDEAGLPVGE